MSTEHRLLAALARRLEGDLRDAPDLAFGVVHRVEALALAAGQRVDAARLAEVDVAGQLAHDQDVEPGDHFGLERGGLGELGIHLRRAQVGEQAELLAQAENRLLRALFSRGSASYFRSADRTEQDGVGRLRQAQRRLGQRMAGRIDAAPPTGASLQFERQAERGAAP